MDRYISTLVLIAAVAIGVACVAPTPADEVEQYLTSATHLTEDQRERFLQGKPYLGMTLAEAEIAMIAGIESASLNDQPLSAIFWDRRGTMYELDFEGTPPAVVAWLHESGEELKLRDIEEFRPILNFWPFR